VSFSRHSPLRDYFDLAGHSDLNQPFQVIDFFCTADEFESVAAVKGLGSRVVFGYPKGRRFIAQSRIQKLLAQS
jgi:hypothetical protein